MSELDPLTLARIQFAFTVSFHIIFPTISIGLALFLTIVEGLWLKTGDLVYRQIYRFWLNIFAMSFGIGVVTTGSGAWAACKPRSPQGSRNRIGTPRRGAIGR